ncbi:MAG: hypothetical protein F6J98_21325 [Moorea sp. SIO4G2]|uniref:hypothetical protein n=1 Tax=unclassified Moorena TaxID=2683338 RepID=UPI0013F893A9|nr:MULTISPECIES: hypothetical protein [unclassified Moorena]NEO11295.1 hypothetical protein [Moorena sp. SIO3E8]NEO62838.1 hypothetical protein [Moorena sp. SIO4G2]NEP97847.1 hypothetical protein [Moorena sp. SIO3F7]
MQSLMGETTPVAHGGDPQDRTGSPRPRCIAVSQAKREWGKPPQVGNGARTVGELNSPRVAPEASLLFSPPPTPHTRSPCLV